MRERAEGTAGAERADERGHGVLRGAGQHASAVGADAAAGGASGGDPERGAVDDGGARDGEPGQHADDVTRLPGGPL